MTQPVRSRPRPTPAPAPVADTVETLLTDTTPQGEEALQFSEPETPEDQVLPDVASVAPPPDKLPEGKSERAILHAQINKQYGPGIIRSALSVPLFPNISTGAFTLDFALMGGIPEMLNTLLFGWESSGKTTIMNRLIASALRKHPEKYALVVDFEGTYDVEWAERHGIPRERLDVVQPATGEEGADIIVAGLECWDYCAVGHDSIAMSTPNKIIQDSAGDINVAPLARLMSILGSKVVRAMNTERRRRHVVSYITTNQFNFKAGGVVFGDPRELPGGTRLNRYIPMTRVELKSKEILGKDAQDLELVDHTEHSFNIKKCKTGISIRQGEFQMAVNPDHPEGFGAILDAPVVSLFAMKMGFITSRGKGKGWDMQDVDEPFAGKEAVYKFLYDNPAEMLRLQQKLISAQRVLKGLPPLPPDGFLLDWNAKDNLEL